MSFLKPSENTRDIIEFWLKGSAILAGLIAALLFGVDHYKKFNIEQEILASLAGDTTLTIDNKVGQIFRRGNQEYCRISGQYQVENIGTYGFFSDQAVIELWEIPHLDDEVVGEKVVSYAISNRIDDPSARHKGLSVDKEIVPVVENFAPKNKLQRSFGFIFKIDRSLEAKERRYDSYYLIEANARAALEPGPKGEASYCKKGTIFGNLFARFGAPNVCFNENDLRHTSHTFYCKDTLPQTSLTSAN